MRLLLHLDDGPVAAVATETREITSVTRRAPRSTDLPAVHHEVHVEGRTKRRGNEGGEHALQALVVEAGGVETQLVVDAKPREHATHVGVHGEHGTPECVEHDAVGALAVDLGERAQEVRELVVGPVTGARHVAAPETLADRRERPDDGVVLRVPSPPRETMDPRRSDGRGAVRPSRRSVAAGHHGGTIGILRVRRRG